MVKKEYSDEINDRINDLRRELYDNFVLKVEFTPVRSIIYGMVGLVLVTVCSALLFLVIQK